MPVPQCHHLAGRAGGEGVHTTYSLTCTTTTMSDPDKKPVSSDLAEKRKRLQEMRMKRMGPSARDTPPGTGSNASSPIGSETPKTETTSPVAAGNVSSITQREASRIIPKQVKLTMVTPEKLSWNVAPFEKAATYSKDVQTNHSGSIESSEPIRDGSPTSPLRRATILAAPPKKADFTTSEPEEHEEPEELSDAQKHNILTSSSFQQFFKTSSFIVERALAEADVIPPDMTDSTEAVFVRGATERLIRTQTFNDAHLPKKITKGCPVTAVDFDPSAHEYFLASYFKRSEGQSPLTDVEGQVIIWNMKMPRPYKILSAPCDVAKVMYSKYHRDLIIGGLYNGQVCIWDTRTQGTDPQTVTPRTMNGHNHPVFGMAVVGNVNVHSLVSVSSDGRVCTWSLQNMNAPTDSQVLYQMSDVGGVPLPEEIQATSLAFRDNETSKFYLGSETGALLSCTKTPSATEALDGHASPITALHCHPANPNQAGDDYSDLVLTSSMDWTCKLWQPNKSNKPLISFDEYTDYVYDVKWSPVHPGLFASVDGSGSLSLWNLLETMEMPVANVSASRKAASRLAWSNDGKSIVVGDAGGDITLWDNEVKPPQRADWAILGHKLSEINAVC
eukprot:TRINITY_DN1611_c0_g1_i2.p1 TRINITY_DN1611_c0_g1~~TRINITY_DN1611_c0_g1_i2.p1  ORF type:complete len:616 (+),score=149.95 TRINITY_DN1611_c0_g1_i2:579-2426(+)